MSEAKPRRGLRIVLWVVAAVVVLVALFFLFEYLNTHLFIYRPTV